MDIRQAQAEYDAVCGTLSARIRKVDVLNDDATVYARECKSILDNVKATERPEGEPRAQVERSAAVQAAYDFIDNTFDKWSMIKRVVDEVGSGATQVIGA